MDCEIPWDLKNHIGTHCNQITPLPFQFVFLLAKGLMVLNLIVFNIRLIVSLFISLLVGPIPY
jgi:hypothetical protein